MYRNQNLSPLSSNRQSMPSTGPVIVGAISKLCNSSDQPLQRYITTSLYPFAFEHDFIDLPTTTPTVFVVVLRFINMD